MDEEDILVLKNGFNLKNSKFNNRIFKVRFIFIFLICIGILILDQIMKHLDNRPELFVVGIIYFIFFKALLVYVLS